MTSENLTKVQDYYAHIDAGDLAWVVALFAENASYDRAGEIHEGRAAIEAFYMTDRKIRVRHSGLRLWQSGDDIFVEGRYQGTGADGSPRGGDFSDHWTFDEAGKVILRRTSLFTGSAAIRD